MSFFKKIILNTITHMRWQHFLSSCHNLEKNQNDLLMKIIRMNKHTDFGKEHNFLNTKTPEDFLKNVPIRDWNGFSSYIDRIMKGHSNVLTDGPLPKMFNRTSGTTGKYKLIPVNEEVIKVNSISQKLWIYSAFKQHEDLLEGKFLPIVNRAVEGYTDLNIPYGAVSGMMFRDANFLIKSSYAYPYSILEIDNYIDRQYALMRFCIPENISVIICLNPNVLIKLFEFVNDNKEKIIKDIYDGTLSNIKNIPTKIRNELNHKLLPKKNFARKLENLIERKGMLLPCDYWENLKLIGCFKNGSVGKSIQKIYQWYPSGISVRDLGLISSEAHISIPILDENNSGLLTSHANFFEFISESEANKSNPKTFLAHQLELGCTYKLIVTTVNGLYRYNINDFIEVTGFLNGAPLIRFLRKGSDICNLQGEKVNTNQVLEAVKNSCEDTGISFNHFMFIGDSNNDCYHLYVEISGENPNNGIMSQFLKIFTEHFCKLNYIFKDLLESKIMTPIKLTVMKPGWLDAIADSRKFDVQFKPSVLGTEPLCKDMIWYQVENEAGHLSFAS